MSFDYKDKVVVVTGGTGQMGRVVAQAYADAGAKVIVADRREPESGTGHQNIVFHHLDVLHEESVKLFFEWLEEQHGAIHALVNTIGGYHAGETIAEMRLTDFEKQFDLNLKSAFLLTKYAVAAMTRHGGGKIVHFSSRAAVDKGAKSFAYSASKLALVRLVEAAAAENLGNNININAVMPSLIDTAINRAAMPQADYSRWPKPEQISPVVLFLTSDEAELISGVALPVYGKF